MPVPSTSMELLALLRKSGLFAEGALTTYVERLRAAGSLPEKAAPLAARMIADGLLTHFQSQQFLRGRYRGFTIGKYTLLERLGSGGMGRVFLAEHRVMKRQVAIKILPAERAADPELLGRFYREAKAVAAVSHPNIVRADDIDCDGDIHFLVTEWVDGTSLADIVARHGPLDCSRAAHYTAQAAAGLEQIRQAGLVHRDVKPGNLVLSRDGVVKLLDLGLARFFDQTHDDNLTRDQADKSVLGTADYLSPEQAQDSHEVDIRTDIYSLGATCYFLLTGRPPFAEGTIAQKLIWHQMRTPPPVRAVHPEVPAALETVVLRMLAKAPGDRYQTPAEVIAALAPWTEQTVPPPPEKEMPQLSPAVRRSRSGVHPAPAPTDTLHASGSATSLGLPGQAPSPGGGSRVSVAARPPATALPPPLSPAGERGKAEGAASTAVSPAPVRKPASTGVTSRPAPPPARERGVSPAACASKTRLPPTAPRQTALPGLPGTRTLLWIGVGFGGAIVLLVTFVAVLWLLTARLTADKPPPPAVRPVQAQAPSLSEVGRFQGHTGAVEYVAFSADGRRALSAGADTRLRLWDVGGRCLLRTFDGHTGLVWCVAFAPDGRRFASGGMDNTVRLWDLATGAQVRSFSIDRGGVSAVAFSPDGQLLLSAGREDTLRLWDVETGRLLRAFAGDAGKPWCAAFSPDGRFLLSGGRDGDVRLWEMKTAREVRRFKGHKGEVRRVTFSPDGRRALSGSFDGTMRLWEVASGQEVRRFDVGLYYVECVSFSPDGRLAVSSDGQERPEAPPRAGDDRGIRLWDLATGRCIIRAGGIRAKVLGVQFSPDGRQVLSASGDGLVRLWQLPETR